MELASLFIARKIAEKSSYSIGNEIFIAKEPSKKDFIIGIHDSVNYESEKNYDYHRNGVQIRIIHKDYFTSNNIAQEILEYIKIQDLIENNIKTVFVNYNDPNFIGFDEKDRAIFVLNLIVHRQQIS